MGKIRVRFEGRIVVDVTLDESARDLNTFDEIVRTTNDELPTMIAECVGEITVPEPTDGSGTVTVTTEHARVWKED